MRQTRSHWLMLNKRLAQGTSGKPSANEDSLFFKDYNLGLCFSICDMRRSEAQMS